MRPNIASVLMATIILILALLAVCPVAAQSGPRPWEQGDAATIQALSKILGSSPDKWKFGSKGRIADVDGRKALVVDEPSSVPMMLTSATTYGPNTEFILTFHFLEPAEESGRMSFQFGVMNVKQMYDNSPGVSIAGSSYRGIPVLGLSVYGPGNTPISLLNYELKGSFSRSLGWDETLRKTVERNLASLPGVTEKWLTYRIVVRNHYQETWLDDRLQSVRADKELNANGHLRINLFPKTALASLQIKPLPPSPPLLRPLRLSGFVNASQFNGHPLDRSTLPAVGREIILHGIPFLFPEPDSHGRDQLALADSWAQFSAMEGYFESNNGEFGGRWPGVFDVNPARIHLRVPYDYYTKLHLIAAADDSKDSVSLVTVQFFRRQAGFPKNYTARIPLFSARANGVRALPVKLQGGTAGSLYLVSIPLDPGELSSFGDLNEIEMELTKEVKLYRSYPDPCCYSFHQGGLPSSVHIFAMTLERSRIAMDFKPDKFGHVWTAPARPSYTVALRNRTAVPQKVQLELAAVSHAGTEKTHQNKEITVPPGDMETPVPFAIDHLQENGYHAVSLTMRNGDQSWTERRSLARLHPDTRERGNWDDGRGALLGMFDWGGGFNTPKRAQSLPLMAEAGVETTILGPSDWPADERAIAEKAGMLFFEFGSISQREEWGDSAKKKSELLERMKTWRKPSAIVRPVEVVLFLETFLGNVTWGNFPEYYGEPEYKLTPDEETNYQLRLPQVLLVGKLLREHYPPAKLMLPYGDPLYCVPFLRRSPEVRSLVDGVALDVPGFEILPERQLHQMSPHRMFELVTEAKKVGKTLRLSFYEGPCAPSQPGALTPDESADVFMRDFLIYFAYGVTRFPSGPTTFSCSDYWGEEHYGDGIVSGIPYCSPKPGYAAFATLSRHLNRANFVKWLPTGSLTTFCLQFKHYKTGKLIHVIWTIRGKRPVTLAVSPGARVSHWNRDDNETVLSEKQGRVTFVSDSSPCYVEGLDSDARVALGEPDHSDSAPGPNSIMISNPGDGTWTMSSEPDKDYEFDPLHCIARFPGKMRAWPVEAPAYCGGKALAVRLEIQEKERKVMPWYTTLAPKRPVVIDGKASHLGIWVKAASDWGRVVYFLRDAKGERWINIGTREAWNCDDTHAWSSFNFDGWRFLRFELPSNMPYDNFREAGSTWWGHYGAGDGIVDLPLSIEKIVVERRSHVIYVNDPQPARPDDVLLGDLYAEYETPFDKTPEAVRQSRIRMPAPEGVPPIGNPIKDLKARGVGPIPAAIQRVEPPLHEYDGTRCLVHFAKTPTAISYSVWVSPYEDGTGALELGRDWTEPGQIMTGLRPETDFYLFLVYTDKDGKKSKPSAPLKIRLRDMFGLK